MSPIKFDVSDILGVGKVANSPAVVRLIDGLVSGVGRIYEDVFGPAALKRRSSAELRVALEAFDALPRDQRLLLDVAGRNSLRVEREQISHQFNRENVAIEAMKIAIEEFPREAARVDATASISPTWLSDFWEISEKVTEFDVQTLWARVLVRKSLFPETIGLRVLQTLSLLSPSEIDQILRIAPFALRIKSPVSSHPDSCGILFNIGQYQGTFHVPKEKKEILPTIKSKLFPIDRNGLDSAGVMQSATGWASEYIVPYSSKLEVVIGNQVFEIFGLPEPNERYKEEYAIGSGYGLTYEGWEICRISNSKPDADYVESIRLAIKSAGCDLVAIKHP